MPQVGTRTHPAVTSNASGHRRRRKLVRIIGLAGRAFVVGGITLLLFTGYLLWGTGVYTKQAQRAASRALDARPLVSEESLSAGNIPPARPKRPVTLGDPLFSIKIPTIGLDHVVVQGVDQSSLRNGVGHFPDCADVQTDECLDGTKYPGERGNVALSGHRTTYGAPFFRLDELKRGDTIDVVSGRARYRYRVREQKVVDPVTGFSSVEQHGRDELTLTTCHPRFSAAQRLVIHADYEGPSLIATPASTSGPAVTDPAERPVIPTDVLVLSSIAVASALGSLALSRRFGRVALRVTVGLGGAAGLWVGAFPRVLALLPTNY